jgi:ABC-type amino acid transport substrate-binding protein
MVADFMRFAGVAAAVALLVGSIVFLRETTRRTDDVLAGLRDRGSIRIAVRPDAPQALAGGLSGFDIDVATELAERLDLRSELVVRTVSEMVGTDHAAWDLAFPSDGRIGGEGFITSFPYYYWPVYLLVPTTSTASVPSDLDGDRICVVDGSAGQTWISGTLDEAGLTATARPPSSSTVASSPDDQGCIDAVGAGRSDALVTAALSPADLAVRPSLRMVGGPIVLEPRTIVAERNGADPTSLLREVDDALSEMRTDGTLANFSRNRFGGNDLTTTPTQ